MKTKEVIRQLQLADPSGEEEVCVGNRDIHYFHKLPAYLDGQLQVLKRDENCKYYNIVGAEYVADGMKIDICTLSIEDAILNDSEIPVYFDRCENVMNCDREKAQVEMWRQEVRDIIQGMKEEDNEN